jgi:hypothetical protein
VAKKFTDCYMDMVGGFLTFPLKFPGTAVWRAMKVGGDFLHGRKIVFSMMTCCRKAATCSTTMLEGAVWAGLQDTAIEKNDVH